MARGGKVQMIVRGWRGESLGGAWRQAVWGLVMAALCVGVVSGAPAAMQPSSSSGDNASGGEVGCERPIYDVLSGFVVTLIAVFVAVWNMSNTIYSQNHWFSKLGIMLVGALAVPIITLLMNFSQAHQYVLLVCHLHKMNKEEMTIRRICAMLNPRAKCPKRILAACHIIMYFRKEDSVVDQERGNLHTGGRLDSINESWIWRNETVEDEAEAMVVGEEPDEEIKKSQSYERKELSTSGKAVLLWGEYSVPDQEKLKILPKYGQLKVLRENSGLAMLAIGCNASGYIYAVIYREVMHLRVSPVEVIGLLINFILLLGALLYCTSNSSARPLVIYMNEGWEGRFVSVLKSKQDFEIGGKKNDIVRLTIWSIIGVVILLLISILLYFIITLKRATNRKVVVPLISFAISIVLGVGSLLLMPLVGPYIFPAGNNNNENSGPLSFREFLRQVIDLKPTALLLGWIMGVLLWMSIIATIVAYVWALVATIYYWQSQGFNTRPQLINLSQVIPFIG